MQALIPKWKTPFIFKKIIVQSSITSTIIPHFADFHSTAPILEKWNSKQNNSDKRAYEKPTKKQIRFVVRQRRSDAKRALNDVVFGNGFTNFSSEPLPRMKGRPEEGEADHFGKKQRSKASARGRLEEVEAGHFGKKQRSKTYARREAKAKRAKRLQKERLGKIHEQFDGNPNVFRATFGNRSYTWTFKADEVPPFQRSTTGFEGRAKSRWDSRKLNESDIESEADEEPCFVGRDSDRLVLGLPAKSPLKIDDVKNAFRLSALKWHPDRHQGPTQASAEEKFKRCVDAYKSLCDALSTT